MLFLAGKLFVKRPIGRMMLLAWLLVATVGAAASTQHDSKEVEGCIQKLCTRGTNQVIIPVCLNRTQVCRVVALSYMHACLLVQNVRRGGCR
jgi:hypothetical protein